MQKPKVFNRTLNKKWAEEENIIMINKLSSVKAKVDIHCPESYVFYQTQFRKTQARNNRLKQFEVDKDNQVLFDKIMNILTVNPNEEIKKRKPKYDLKKDISQAKKYDYFKISQENQYLLKRLNDKNSFYDIKSWEKDYDKSQTYKKNLCVFPSIDFRKTNQNNFEMRNHSYKNKSLYDKIKLLSFNNLTVKNRENKKFGLEIENENGKNMFDSAQKYSQVTNENEYCGLNKRKILYNRKMFLNELSHCSVTFFIQDKKFVIEIEPITVEKMYYIVFDDLEEIEKMQKLYKKYEQIINDLDYDFVNDKILIKNKGEINIIYKSLAINNQEKLSLGNKHNFTVAVETNQNIDTNSENQLNTIKSDDKQMSEANINKFYNNHEINYQSTHENILNEENLVRKEKIHQISENDKEDSISYSSNLIYQNNKKKSSPKSHNQYSNLNSSDKKLRETPKRNSNSSNSKSRSLHSINYDLENYNEAHIEENLN